jgi:hypothetical protein
MDIMIRICRTVSGSLTLVVLAMLTCTKLPSDMATLTPNISATMLLAPADGSTDNVLSPRLAWESVAGATGYHVQVSTQTDFSKIVFEDTSVADTFKVASGLKYQTTYYWRVQVHDARGLSDWTTSRNFATIIEPQVPAVVLPKDSAINEPLSLTLTWNSASGAASYCVQVASDSGFTIMVAVDSTLADTTKVLSNLLNSDTYYWHVRSQNPGGVSSWTSTKSFTTTIAAPVSPLLISPASGAVKQQLALVLAWNKVSGASSYYVEVAGDIAFANIYLQDSAVTDTTKSVAGLASGVLYYWRVMAKNLGGISAWSLVSGFTTFAAAPQQPVLISPADGAASQTIPLTVSWNKAVGAAAYYLQVAIDTGFASISISDSSLTDTTRSLAGLANNTKYYWRVQGRNPAGVSFWSMVRSFITFATALGTPVLKSPADAATGQSLAPVVSWQGVSGAKNYRVQVSIGGDFSTIFAQDSGLTDSSVTLTGLVNNTTYFWRVRAENTAGFGNWTSPWRFTTVIAAPQIPTLVAPADGATGQQLSLALTWNTAAGAATYSVQVAADSNFASTIAQDSLIADTTQIIGGLLNNTTYYWRVVSKNAVGTSGWSGRRSFTTFAATLSTPTLASPQNGASGVSIPSTLTWSTVTNATTYEVQISGAQDFSTVFIDDATLTSGSKSASGLLYSTTYYWRVRAKSLSGTSNWTDPWSFTTVVTTPATPALVSPSDNAGNQPLSLTLAWNKTTGAATYNVQVAVDTGFIGIVSSDTGFADTLKSVSGLLNGTIYYWKVRGKNASGYGSWSVYRTFTTVVAPPASPVLSSPADSAINLSLSPQLSWSLVTGAVVYHVQVSTASDFSTGLVVDDSTLMQTSKSIGPLSTSATYYWHVAAKNAGGTGAWSGRRSFTTVPPVPSAPVLSLPADGATGQPVSVTLAWNSVVNAATYRVQVSTSSDFSALVLDDSTLTAASRLVAGLVNGTTYYWRVLSKNVSGASSWSSARSFATAVIVVPPTQIYPADLAAKVPLSTTFSWAPVNGATSYYLQVSSTYNWSNLVVNDSSISTASFIVGGLTNGTTYWWRVKARNADTSSAWSPSALFLTILATPLPPTLVNAPANGAVSVTIPLSISWTAQASTTTYRVQISTWATMTAQIVLDTQVTTPGVTINHLSPSTVYYWRVMALNTDTTSDWTVIRNFTTTAIFWASTNATTNAVECLASSGSGLYAGSYGLFFSSNNGASWTNILGNQDISSVCVTNTNLYVGTGIGFWSSSDNGTSYLHVLGNQAIYGVTALGTKWLAGTDSGIVLSADSGATWWIQNTGLPVNRLNAFFQNGNGLFAATTQGVVLSTDTAKTWTVLGSSILQKNIHCLVQMGTTVFACSDSNVYKSVNGGVDWTQCTDAGLPGSNRILSLAQSGTHLYAGTASLGVFMSTDNGASWTPISSGLPLSLNNINYSVNSLVVNGSSLAAGTDKGVYMVTPAP